MFLVFFSFWELVFCLKWIDFLIFSFFIKVWYLFLIKFIDGLLVVYIGFILFEMIFGFILGILLGILFVMVFWYLMRFVNILDFYFVILNVMLKVVLGFILIVVIGLGFFLILMMGVIIFVIIIFIVVYIVFKEVDLNYIKLLKSFGVMKICCFKEVILLVFMFVIIFIFKVNVGLFWVGVIVGEFLVFLKGFGYMIIYGF